MKKELKELLQGILENQRPEENLAVGEEISIDIDSYDDNDYSILKELNQGACIFDGLCSDELYEAEIATCKLWIKRIEDKMKKFAECKKEFGSIEFDGKEYALAQQAYLDGTETPYYTATAIDEEGNKYTVYWEVLNLDNFSELDDEENACDWDSPVNVKRI